LVTFAVLTPSACSAGEEADGSGAAENSFAPHGSYSEEDIDHLLTRAEFGIELAHRHLTKNGASQAYVDQVLSFPTPASPAV